MRTVPFGNWNIDKTSRSWDSCLLIGLINAEITLGSLSDLLETIHDRDKPACEAILARDDIDLDIASFDDPEYHPILAVCAYGSPAMLAAVLKKSSHSDAFDRTYESYDNGHSLTPLAMALLHGNKEAANYLAKLGADVNSCYRTTSRPDEEMDIAEHFQDSTYGRDSGVCWWLADKELLRDWQLSGVIHPDVQAPDESNAMCHAILNGDPERIDSLLALGASPDVLVGEKIANHHSSEVSEYFSALMLAVVRCQHFVQTSRIGIELDGNAASSLEIVKRLVRAGPDLSIVADCLENGAEGTVCDWVLHHGCWELQNIFGLQMIRQRHDEMMDELEGVATGWRLKGSPR